MSICVTVDTATGAIIKDTSVSAPACPSSDYQLLTPAELSNLKLDTTSIDALLQNYFGFDAELFSLVLVACLTAFALGFSVSVVYSIMTKTA